MFGRRYSSEGKARSSFHDVADPVQQVLGRRSEGRSRWAAGVCFALAIHVVGGCKPTEKPQGAGSIPVRVEVATVKVAPLDVLLTAVGSLSSPQDTVVSPQISGRVVALNIHQGRVVAEGTVLARLDDGVEKAAVMSAEAALFNARQIYARDSEVAGTGAVSEKQVQSDEAAVQDAQAQLDRAQVNLQNTTIRAPFAGVLGLRKVSLGAYVEPGDAIVSIRQLDPLHLDFDLPQQNVRFLKEGQEARFAVAGLPGVFRGRVTTLAPALAGGSRTIRVQCTVRNPDRRLKPGMFTMVHLVVGRISSALFVPMQAIVPEGQVRRVWVVGPDGQAEQRTVEVGVYQNTFVQILSGLKSTDRVVTAGLQKLYPGARLIITPYQPIHNPRLSLSVPEVRKLP